jgi:hypothetical protein
MHLSMAMMLAIAGLGCENRPLGAYESAAVMVQPDGSPALPSYQQGAYLAPGYTTPFPSTPYPDIPSQLYPRPDESRFVDWHAGIQSTLWSFVLGHDRDIVTVREIEASVYGDDSAH